MLEDFQYHHRNESNHHPFGDYFDVQALSKLVQAVTFDIYMEWCCQPGRKIIPIVPVWDTTEQMLQLSQMEQELGFKSCLGPTTTFGGLDSLEKVFKGAANGSCFALLGGIGDTPSIPIYGADDSLLPNTTVKAWGFIDTSDPKITMRRAIVQALVPKRDYQTLAESLLSSLNCEKSIAMHVRLGDYKFSHCMKDEDVGWPKVELCPSNEHMLHCLLQSAEALPGNISLIVIAPPEDLDSIPTVIKVGVAEYLGSKVCEVRTVTELVDWNSLNDPVLTLVRDRPDIWSMVEQMLASWTTMFIGNMFSSWSGRVFANRATFGYPYAYWHNCSKP